MITHFAELRLHTVSLQGVRQFYADRLGLAVIAETDRQLVLELTPHIHIIFEEEYLPITPIHIAFEVPYDRFAEMVDFIKGAGLVILKFDDGSEVGGSQSRGYRLIYFRDGDGHLLELICHNYLARDVLSPHGPLHALYLREVGFPVESVPVFREWLRENLEMTPLYYANEATGETVDPPEDFRFVVGGTAYAVVVSKKRPWVPIAMKALPPNMHVAFGTPDLSYFERVRDRLQQTGDLVRATPQEIFFTREGYSMSLRLTPEFSADTPQRLGLPLANRKAEG